MTWETVMAAALGVSVTMNVAFLIKESQLAQLRADFTREIAQDRHKIKNRITRLVESVVTLRAGVRQLIATKSPEMYDKVYLGDDHIGDE